MASSLWDFFAKVYSSYNEEPLPVISASVGVVNVSLSAFSSYSAVSAETAGRQAKSALETYADAMTAFGTGHFEEAIRLCKKAITELNDSIGWWSAVDTTKRQLANMHHLYGLASLGINNKPMAEKQFLKAYKLNDSMRSIHSLVFIYYMLSEFELTESFYERSLSEYEHDQAAEWYRTVMNILLHQDIRSPHRISTAYNSLVDLATHVSTETNQTSVLAIDGNSLPFLFERMATALLIRCQGNLEAQVKAFLCCLRALNFPVVEFIPALDMRLRVMRAELCFTLLSADQEALAELPEVQALLAGNDIGIDDFLGEIGRQDFVALKADGKRQHLDLNVLDRATQAHNRYYLETTQAGTVPVGPGHEIDSIEFMSELRTGI